MEEKKLKKKTEKGSVTLFVLLTMLFFIIVLIAIYTSQINKINAQKKQVLQIEENYSVDDYELDKAYKDVQNGMQKDTEVDIKIYYTNDSETSNGTEYIGDAQSPYTNQDMILEIKYPEGIEHKYWVDDKEEVIYKDNEKNFINKNCEISVKDNNGKSLKTITVDKIDKLKPTVTLSPDGGNFAKATSGNSIIKTKLTGNDEAGTGYGASGVKTRQYAWSQSSTLKPSDWSDFYNGEEVNKTTSTAGTYFLWVKIEDNAGNILEKASNKFIIDSTSSANKITLSAKPAIDTWTNGWTKETVIVTPTYGSNLTTESRTLTCTGSSITDYTKTGTTKVEVKTNGKEVTASAKDSAGNVVTTSLQVNNIDKGQPTISLETAKITSDTNYSIDITFGDTLSGLKNYTVTNSSNTTISSGTLSSKSDSKTIEKLNFDTTYTIKVWDMVGNVYSATKSEASRNYAVSKNYNTSKTWAWTYNIDEAIDACRKFR